MNQATETSPVVNISPVIGLDVGDRKTHACVLDSQRQVEERFQLATTPDVLRAAFEGRAPSKIVLEVGSQSPWMAPLLRSLGHEVLVADSRRSADLIRSDRKTDRRDAEVLARVYQGMPEMLGSVYHRGDDDQAGLAVIRSRDLVVRMRTMAVQHVRGTCKAAGIRLKSCSAASFERAVRDQIPTRLKPAIDSMLDQIKALNETIKDLDRTITECTKRRSEETAATSQIRGVGTLVSTAFVLTISDPTRFKRSRDVGSWVGLCPRVRSSGDVDPQLSISKAGCPYLRRLLVQSAQYILGPFGEDCDLRRAGLRIAERGGKAGKRRAVVAVARKLAILMHRLWITGEKYEPLRNASRRRPEPSKINELAVTK